MNDSGKLGAIQSHREPYVTVKPFFLSALHVCKLLLHTALTHSTHAVTLITLLAIGKLSFESLHCSLLPCLVETFGQFTPTSTWVACNIVCGCFFFLISNGSALSSYNICSTLRDKNVATTGKGKGSSSLPLFHFHEYGSDFCSS